MIYPPPPDLLESETYTAKATKIFEYKGLICKIFIRMYLHAENLTLLGGRHCGPYAHDGPWGPIWNCTVKGAEKV